MNEINEWVEKRKGKISASNVAAILGLKPFGKTPIDAWSQIMGYSPEQADKPVWRMGRKAEAMIADLYSEDAGVKLVTPQDPMVHAELPWLCGTPDRLIVGQPKGVEIKNVGKHMLYGWGEPGTDEIPDYYLMQVAVYMAITRYDVFDVVASLAGEYPTVFPIRRDKQLENNILKLLDEWYVIHIVGNTPPEPDSSIRYSDFLKNQWPRDKNPLKRADGMTEFAMEKLAEARKACDEAEELKVLYENVVKAYIGDAEGVEGECGKITWKATKDSVKIDYEGITEELFQLSEIQELLVKYDLSKARLMADYTSITPGSRRFLARLNK